MTEEISSARETLRVRSARNQRRRQNVGGVGGGGNPTMQVTDTQPEPPPEGSNTSFYICLIVT